MLTHAPRLYLQSTKLILEAAFPLVEARERRRRPRKRLRATRYEPKLSSPSDTQLLFTPRINNRGWRTLRRPCESCGFLSANLGESPCRVSGFTPARPAGGLENPPCKCRGGVARRFMASDERRVTLWSALALVRFCPPQYLVPMPSANWPKLSKNSGSKLKLFLPGDVSPLTGRYYYVIMSRARIPASLGVCMDAVPKHSRRLARSSARTTRHELRVTSPSAGSTRWRMPCHPSFPTTHQLRLTTHCIPNRHTNGLEMPVTPFPATKVAVLIATDLGGLAAYLFHQARRPIQIVDAQSCGVRPGRGGPQGLYLQTLLEKCTALPFLSSRRRPHRPFRENPNGLFSQVTCHEPHVEHA
jgi:hypothetical protein